MELSLYNILLIFNFHTLKRIQSKITDVCFIVKKRLTALLNCGAQSMLTCERSTFGRKCNIKLKIEERDKDALSSARIVSMY